MKQIVQLSVLLAVSLFLPGCLLPVKNEIPLVSNEVMEKPANPNDTKLVIFNDSNFLAFGLDGAGRINVKLNGKGVTQLNIGCYAQIVVPKGRYEVDLVHRDMGDFVSQHQIELTDAVSFLEIFATPTSNKAFLISRPPPNFQKKFKPVK